MTSEKLPFYQKLALALLSIFASAFGLCFVGLLPTHSTVFTLGWLLFFGMPLFLLTAFIFLPVSARLLAAIYTGATILLVVVGVLIRDIGMAVVPHIALSVFLAIGLVVTCSVFKNQESLT